MATRYFTEYADGVKTIGDKRFWYVDLAAYAFCKQQPQQNSPAVIWQEFPSGRKEPVAIWERSHD